LNNAIPDQVLTQHTAFLGKTGSGKTSTAKLAVEQIVRDDPAARVCVLDPIKSDWWGLTSSSDGRRPGLPFYILGGPRGHVPLHDSAGKVIGELVANGSLPLSIIDMADFTAGGLQKFFNDFAPALMKHMRGVVYLVIEEAHEFAPKERSGIGAENMAIHWAKKLATAGRSKGIRMMVLTQRTQALHNALLGSCDTMIAHRLTAPADQEPVKKWLKANVDKEIFEKVSSSLSKLKTGSGWICSGEAQLADLVQFPKISTYDNSATPTSDTAERFIQTAPVDQSRLRTLIGDAAQKEESNDPTKLRAEIARLTTLTKATPNIPQNIPDPAAIDAAEQRGYVRGHQVGREFGERIAVFHTKLAEDASRILKGIEQTAGAMAIQIESAIEKFEPGLPAELPVAAPTRAPNAAVPRTPSPAASGDGNLPGPQQRIINSLVTWKKLGHQQPSNAQVAWLATYSPSSTSYTNPRSALKTAGLISYPVPDHIEATDTGLAAGSPISLSGSLLEFVLGQLPGPEARILKSVAKHFPKAIDNETAASGANYSASSTSYTNPRSALRTKDLITYPSIGMVRAADWLF
jgi:hypothetical protein